MKTESRKILKLAWGIMEEAYQNGWVQRPSALTEAKGRASAYFKDLSPGQMKVALEFEKNRPRRDQFPADEVGEVLYKRENRLWNKRRNKAVGGTV